MVEPLDTSQLGPVSVMGREDKVQAKIVRGALAAMANEMDAAGFPGKARAFFVLSTLNDDAALAKLRRYLK